MQMMQMMMQQQMMQARLMAEQTVAAAPATAAAAAAAPAGPAITYTPEQMQAYMAQQQQAYMMAMRTAMAQQQQQAQWLEQQQQPQQVQANKSKPAKRPGAADAQSANKKQKPLVANAVASPASGGAPATAASSVSRMPTASQTAYQQQQALLRQMEINRQQQLLAAEAAKPKPKLTAAEAAKAAAAHALEEKQKQEEALDDQTLFPRVAIKKLIKSALPLKEPVERSATRAINLSAVEFCNLVTSEANHIRLQEKHLRTQISIRHTVRSSEKLEAKLAAHHAAAASGVPLDPAEEAKDEAFVNGEARVLATVAKSLSEPVLPEAGRDDFGARQAQGDGSVLTGHHILAALVRLGFSQYARIAGSFLVNQVLLPNEQINETLKQNRREGALLLREHWKMPDANHEHLLHIPSDPAAPENCIVVPGSDPPVAHPSDVLHISAPWQSVKAGDADRAAKECAEESRRSLQQWMANNENLPSTPLYPNHPITQPGYKPIPCPLQSNCILVLEAQQASDGLRGSPHKAGAGAHGHGHRLPAAIGGVVVRKKAPAKPSFDRSSDAKDPPVRWSVAKGDVKKQPKRSSAAKVAANQTYKADELGPPKTPRRAAADVTAAAAAAGEHSEDAKPADDAPVSTGIVDEGEHAEEEEAQQQQQRQQPADAETQAPKPAEQSVEGTRDVVDADAAMHS